MFQVEDRDKNVRSRYNGRQFLSWLQDVDDKYEKIKVIFVQFLLYNCCVCFFSWLNEKLLVTDTIICGSVTTVLCDTLYSLQLNVIFMLSWTVHVAVLYSALVRSMNWQICNWTA